jgi:hypothetical protein
MHCKIIYDICAGFGNKIFDIIAILYLINRYNCNVYALIKESSHNKKSDPKIFDIFPGFKEHKQLQFVKPYQYYKIKNDNKTQILDVSKIKKLSDLPNLLNGTYDVYQTAYMYRFITEMYSEIKETKFKNIFDINKQLITNEIINFAKSEYVCVHIRYGDKLKIAFKKKTTKFIIYKPEYYIELIKFFLKQQNIPIYIVTDSNNIVEQFILPYVKNPRVQLLKVSYWDSFYLLKNSTYSVLSFSTFGLLASLFNKKLKQSTILVRDKNDTEYIPEDDLIPMDNMFVMDNKKLILNYDVKMVKKMYEVIEKKIYFITYGDDKFEKSKKRIIKEAKDFGYFKATKVFTPKDLTTSFVKEFKDILNMERLGGYGIWKFDIIMQTLLKIKEGDYLIYLDAGCTINKNGIPKFKKYIKALDNSKYGIISFQMSYFKEKEWTIKEMFTAMNMVRESKEGNSGQYLDGILIMKKNKHTMTIFKECLEFLSTGNNKYLLTDEFNDDQAPYFKENRHDQSILSLMRKKHGSVIFKDETCTKYKKTSPFIATRIRE